jgi:hypothetical protein
MNAGYWHSSRERQPKRATITQVTGGPSDFRNHRSATLQAAMMAWVEPVCRQS